VYNFIPYYGDTGKLPTNENHFNCRWNVPGVKVLFSMTRRGNAVVCHFASDKKGRRKLKQAINDFCESVFERCEWCEMIIGPIKKDSIKRLSKKCGFKSAGTKDNISLMIRKR
jgi:hypothetical protein